MISRPGDVRTAPAHARVLIVDDEPSICKALSHALRRDGYDVVTALGGEAALAILREQRIDVLLVDLRMPDMRGDVLFEYAVAIRPELRARTLFMTGDITDRATELIAACGCHFLRKPFDLRDLSAAVAALRPLARGASA